MDIVTLHGKYDIYKENALPQRRFKYNKLNEVLQKHLHKKKFNFLYCGYSFEKRPINLLKYGSGPTTVLIISQMHGNEPVSTLALTDVMNFMESEEELNHIIKEKITVYVLALVNPDGNEKNDRRNAQGIDINRDAKSLISPEAIFLTKVVKEINPKFVLNLHDEELYYMTKPLLLQTAIAMLAPECEISPKALKARSNAMKLISCISQTLEPIAKNRIARYDDVYTPEAFGDTFISNGISSVLIEAGSSEGDKERCFARKTVFCAILTALEAVANSSYDFFSEDIYQNLPLNIRYKSFDLKLKNLEIKSEYGSYRVDLGIRRIKPTFNDEDFTDDFTDYRIVNIGKLDNYGALKTFDASEFCLKGNYSDIYIGKKSDFTIINNFGIEKECQSLLL